MRRSIQLITLHCVLAAAEEGSILAASRRVGMHHSALSRRIRELEGTLGVRLFDRHPGGVRPTEVGEQLLERLSTILGDLDGTLTVVEATSDNSSLAIGFEESIPVSQVVGVATGFLERRPKISVRFQESCREHLVEAFQHRKLDLMISFNQDLDDRMSALQVWCERVFVAVYDKHPLAAGGVIEWSQLLSETVLLAERVSAPWCGPLLERQELSCTTCSAVWHDVRQDCLLALVREGLGVTLLREGEPHSNLNGLVAVPLSHAGEPVHIPCFACWRSDNTNPVLAAFVRFLRARCRNS